jgi:hypothetical protein
MLQRSSCIYCPSSRPLVDRLSSGSSSEFQVVLLQIKHFGLAFPGTFASGSRVQCLTSLGAIYLWVPLHRVC